MTILAIILGIVVVLETAYIFLISKVLKNTFNRLVDARMENKSKFNPEVAYNGEYYTANVLAQTVFGAECEMVVADFSRYESHGIVGFSLHVPETKEEYYRNYKGVLSEEEFALVTSTNIPAIFPNTQVYEIEEGTWTWK